MFESILLQSCDMMYQDKDVEKGDIYIIPDFEEPPEINQQCSVAISDQPHNSSNPPMNKQLKPVQRTMVS
jgi:hypothetical protein